MGEVRCYSRDTKITEEKDMMPDLLEDLLAFAFVTKSPKRDICSSCGSDLEADGRCLVCEGELEENDDDPENDDY
jgi:predicted amidophosphoribosyltransferase